MSQSNDQSWKRQRTSGPDQLQCQICGRAYERADHLTRHLDSRPYLSPHIGDMGSANYIKTVTKGLFDAKHALLLSIAGIYS